MVTASVIELLTCLRQFPKRTPGCILWLGAGASVSSGIPCAEDIVTDLLRECHAAWIKLPARARDPISGQDVRSWARSNLSWFGKPDQKSEYALTMENALRTPGARQEYLRRLMDNAWPSKAYVLLGLLLKKRVFDTVVTTNFDDLVWRGCAQVHGPPITVVNTSAQFRRLTPHGEQVRLVRLHGDFDHGDLLNTEPELEKAPSIRFDAIRRLFRSYGLIVIGYGGWDVRVMGSLFAPLWKDKRSDLLSKGVYWCHLRGTALSPYVRSFLDEGPRDRAFSVEIPGFDAFISELAEHFEVHLSDQRDSIEELRVAWEGHAFIKDLLDKILLPACPTELLETQQEVLSRMATALDLRQAVLVHRAPESGGLQTVARFNIPGAAAEVRLDSPLLAPVTEHRLDTRNLEPSQLAQDPYFRTFSESRYIQSFFVWRSGELAGFVTLGADQPLADNSGVVKNVVRLLVCAPEFAAEAPGAGAAGAGAG